VSNSLTHIPVWLLTSHRMTTEGMERARLRVDGEAMERWPVRTSAENVGRLQMQYVSRGVVFLTGSWCRLVYTTVVERFVFYLTSTSPIL
jgi:hypothetical protein